MARGKSRNPLISEIIKEAEKIAEKGVKEVVLTGVNIGDFGKSTGETFAQLLVELDKINGIERFRISSIEPNLLTDGIIEMAARNEKILPHFHIPLQSGSDKILGLMRRRYKREVFAERIRQINRTISHAGIGADVIVGFPGETDSDFEDTYSFLEELPLSYLHVFSFSERPGTVAEKLAGKVKPSEKGKRSRRLITLSENKHREFAFSNIGLSTAVLFERTRIDGFITGFTSNYLRVEYPWQSTFAGQIKKVRLTGITPVGRVNAEIID